MKWTPIDLTGQRFGKLVAVEPTEQRKGGSVVWRCRCDCGSEIFASVGQLRNGRIHSCGCGRRKDIAGQRFGKLVAVEPTERRNGSSIVWRCHCDCGNECFVSIGDLRSGNTKSCGCAKRKGKDIAGQRFGRLVAIEPTKQRRGLNIIWRCRCDCGKEHFAAVKDLCSGNTKSCGCLNLEPHGKCEDVVGGTRASALNKTIARNNTSGIRGVSWDKRSSKWAAYIKHKGRYYHLGMFRDIEDARKARERAEESLHGNFLKDFSVSVLERAESSETNIQGERYGTLTVLYPVIRGRHIVWRCQCDCGTLVDADADSLASSTAFCPKCRQSGQK